MPTDDDATESKWNNQSLNIQCRLNYARRQAGDTRQIANNATSMFANECFKHTITYTAIAIGKLNCELKHVKFECEHNEIRAISFINEMLHTLDSL